jgi:hypothetical protein
MSLKEQAMNPVTAYATNPTTGENVSVSYTSWACNLIDQFSGAAREIERQHGFLIPNWQDPKFDLKVKVG